MRLRKNLLAGAANSVWSALIGLAVTPIYLKYLGIEAYGLIGFFAMTQVLLQLLDMGLAPTINREVARCAAGGKIHEAKNLLHTIAIVYWGMALLIALTIVSLGYYIAEYWLNSTQLSKNDLNNSIALIGLVIACRWPIGLYQGAIMGAQRIIVSSRINISMVTLSSFGAVGILAYVSPTIQAFFLWQVIVGIIYAITMRRAAWQIIGKKKEAKFDVTELKRIWRFSLSMSVISLMGLIFSQMDKVILSKILSLEAFGYYALATVVVSSLYLIVTPVYNVLYPRFSSLVVSREMKKLEELYRFSSRSMAVIIFPVTMTLVVLAKDLVYLWTGNVTTASSVAPLISLMAIGSAFHGIMYIPHALQLAMGLTRLPLMINGILMIVFFPLIIILALKYSAMGGAIAWLTLHICYLLLGTWLTHREIFKDFGARWLLIDLGFPLALSAFFAFFLVYILSYIEYSENLRIAAGATLGIINILAGTLLSPTLRSYLICEKLKDYRN